MEKTKLLVLLDVGVAEVYSSTEYIAVLSTSKEEFLFELELAFEEAIKKIAVLKEKMPKDLGNFAKSKYLTEADCKLILENNLKRLEAEKEIGNAHFFKVGDATFEVLNFIPKYSADITKSKFKEPVVYTLDEWFDLKLKNLL